MKKVVIIILHYKQKNLTADCLESISKLSIPVGFTALSIIVNNNPDDDLSDLINKYRNCVFVAAGKNLGYVGGNNFGIKKALERSANYILLLNNDTIVDKQMLKHLLETAESEEEIGIVGPKIYFASGREYHYARYKKSERGRVIWFAGGIIDWANIASSHRGVDEVDRGQYDKTEETDFVSGCCMLIKRQVVDEIGILDEKYFLYLEDNDYCRRAKQAGFRIYFEPKAFLHHVNAASSEVGGDLQDYYISRNRMFFGMKFASSRTKLSLIKESFKLLFFGRVWQKIGIRDYYLGKCGKGSY